MRKQTLAAIAFAAALNPTANAQRCTSAAGPVDYAICADPQLAVLESRIEQVYQHLLPFEANPHVIVDHQQRWQADRRNTCASVPPADMNGCVRSFDISRLSALTKALDNRKRAAAAASPTPAAAQAPGVPAPSIPKAADPVPSPVDYEDREIGVWVTSGTFDRFGDGGTFAAITGDGQIAFAVRCLQKHLSLGIIMLGPDPKPLQKEATFDFKIRVDAQPVIETKGIAISERLIQLLTEKEWVKAMRDGSETALRMEDEMGVVSTHIFKMRGAPRAFADLAKECPLD